MRALLLLLLSAPALAAGPAASSWPQFRGDWLHASTSTVNGFTSLGNTPVRLRWSRDLGFIAGFPDRYRGPSMDGSNLYVATPNGITAVSLATGLTVWSTTVPGSGFSQPAVAADGRVYTSTAGYLMAFWAADGSMAYHRRLPGLPSAELDSLMSNTLSQMFDLAPPLLGPDGSVYILNGKELSSGSGGQHGAVAVTSTDTVRWARYAANTLHSAALSPDGTTMYFKAADGANGTVYAVDVATGGVVWRAATNNSSLNSYGHAIAVDGLGQVYTFADNYALRELDPVTGATGWTSTVTFSALHGYPPTVTADGSVDKVYVVDGSVLYAFNRTLGQYVAGLNLGSESTIGQVGPPALAGNGSLFLLARKNGRWRLFNIEPTTLALRWELDYAGVTDSNLATPAVTVGNNAVLVHTSRNGGNHLVHAFEPIGDSISMVVSSNAASMSGDVQVTTVTVTVRNSAQAPVSGVPVQLTGLAYGPSVALASPGAPAVVYTDLNGQATFQHRLDFASTARASFASQSSTMTFEVPSLAPQSIVIRPNVASTFTVTASAPSIEDNGTTIVRVTTLTITVLDALAAPVPNHPVALEALDHTANLGGLCGTPASVSLASNYLPTDGAGQAQVVHRLTVAAQNFDCAVAPDDFQNFQARVRAYAQGLAAVDFDTRETRVASLTTSFSTGTITPDVGLTTLTVTARDSGSNPVPYAIVALNNLPAAPASVFGYSIGARTGSITCLDDTHLIGYTDGSGTAAFVIRGRKTGCGGASDYDDFDDTLSTFPVYGYNVAPTSPTALLESNMLSGFIVDAPTTTPVGIAFVSTITAVNKYNHTLPYYTGANHPLVPLFAGTEVQGTGTLGTSAVTFSGATNGSVVVSSQTYNKVEQIEIKAYRSSDNKSGRSAPIDVTGPTGFVVHVPTSATAGNPFSMTVEAVDALGRRVIGYTATLSLSALQASNTAQAGAGILGTTNVNLPGNGIVTIANQTYTKAEAIKLRAFESATSKVGVSTDTLAVAAGTPVSLTLSANPQSTIASVPSVLSSEVQDLFGNKVVGATITYSVPVGSGVVSLSFSGPGAASTQAVTGALGTAQAFFISTNTLSSQANIVRAQLGALLTDTTVYNSVLITAAGGTVANLGDPRIRVDCPANSWAFNIRMAAQRKEEFSGADLALTTAAFAAQPNVFISTLAARFTAVRDGNPNAAAGNSSNKVTIHLPFSDDGSGNVTVGSYGPQSLLVPFSVLRVFKLNRATSLFEMVLDGTNLSDISSRVVSAQVLDPDGIYAVGAPAFTPLSPASSGTVTAVLAAGATAEVTVPFGAFTSATNLTVSAPSAASVPALPSGRGIRGTGLTVSVQTTNNLQPVRPVTVTIGYRASDVVGMDPDTLRIARYDPATGWVILDSRVDTLQREVTGETDHFSLFQLVSISPAQTLSSGLVFPNPFRPSQGHTALKFGQLPVAARIKVFSVSGRLLRELEADSTGQVLNWDATDKDGRKLPSGVYLALIESGSDKRTLKFAIQR